MAITPLPAVVAATGIPGLDNILLGGLPRNHVYLVQGHPGVGKTTLARQFLMEGARRGEGGLYITLSESEAELHEVAASHGWSLDGITIFEFKPAAQPPDEDQDHTVFHTSEVELGEAMKTLLDEVERSQPSRVVFDSLSDIRMMAQQPLRYRRQILALKQHFAGTHRTVLLLDDLTSSAEDKQLESLAHGVIALEQVPPAYGVDRRRVRVTKLRGVRFRTGYHDLLVDTGGLRVFPRLIASEHRRAVAHGQAESDIPALDARVGGGLDRGRSTLILGPAGSGKSVLASQYAVAAEARGVALELASDERAGPVRGDAERLPLVAWNLLTNAVKFTPRGGRVSVRLRRVDGAAELVVADTGQGFRGEFLPFLFERFRQADGSTTRAQGGLGLGLAGGGERPTCSCPTPACPGRSATRSSAGCARSPRRPAGGCPRSR